MADNLDEIAASARPRRRSPRRSFLAAAGLLGGSAALAACSGGSLGGRVGGTGGERQRPAPAAARRRPASRRAGRHREAAVHVQLVRLRRPDNMERFKAQVRRREVHVRHVRQQRGAARQAPGAARRATTSPRRRPSSCRRMVEQGFIAEARLVADPEPEVHQPAVQGPLVGPEQRVPAAQGLGHDRHPVPQQVRQGEVKTWRSSSTSRPKYSGKIVVVDSMGDVLVAAAQGARLLAELGRPEGDSTRRASPARSSRRTSLRSTPTPTRTSSRTRRPSWA